MGSITTDLPRIHQETQFNINQKVKVELTPRGLEVLRQKLRELEPINQVDESIRLRYLRDGTYTFQMYEFMAIFGSELPTFATSAAKYQLFERNDIVLLP